MHITVETCRCTRFGLSLSSAGYEKRLATGFLLLFLTPGTHPFLFFKDLFNFNSVYMCVCVWMCAHECSACGVRRQHGISGFKDSYELPEATLQSSASKSSRHSWCWVTTSSLCSYLSHSTAEASGLIMCSEDGWVWSNRELCALFLSHLCAL